MVREAISYFNKQVAYECKPTYLSKQVEYKTINATLFEPISANELSAKLRLPTDVYVRFYSCRQCWASKSRGL